MFNTLESNWDNSARRRWTTFASFMAQAVALTFLLALSLLWIERPPQVRWLLTSPTFATSESPAQIQETHRGAAIDQPVQKPLIVLSPHKPQRTTATDVDRNADTNAAASAPAFSELGSQTGRLAGNNAGNNIVPFGLGAGPVPAIPPQPAATKPVVVSNLGEGSVIHRVQPEYPALARQARVQGSVELRAIISKTGAIEKLVVVHGHPMLSAAAIEAVRQWRYRPYLLNNQPVEVETEITVNFLLGGS